MENISGDKHIRTNKKTFLCPSQGRRQKKLPSPLIRRDACRQRKKTQPHMEVPVAALNLEAVIIETSRERIGMLEFHT